MVIQHGKSVHLWGEASPGAKIHVKICKEESAPAPSRAGETAADPDGRWSVTLPAMDPGYERYCIVITDEEGGEIEIGDVVVGAVWYASGQSNMDLMMQRVADRYPREIRESDFPFIRSFKIQEHTDYHGPLSEPETGQWTVSCPETILDFSASAWFFSTSLQKAIDMPVGYLHASLGGSHVAGWMSAEMLANATPAAPDGYPALLEEARRYSDDSYIASQVKNNEKVTSDWDAELNRRLSQDGNTLPEEWKKIGVPCFFRDIPELDGFIGNLTIRRRFTLTPSMLEDTRKEGSRIRLFLGTMVDRDKVFVNGKFVGETLYQYPPRKYEIPASLLRAGENEVEISLIVERGAGRLTPEKDYMIFCENKNEIVNIRTHEGFYWCVDLSGEWEYCIRAVMPEPMQDQDFINWHPTGLYNGMTAPCHAWPIEGILWYQGESDAGMKLPDGRDVDYTDLLQRMIRGYRKAWRDDQLPFLIVQLPNFTVDLCEETSWPAMRRMQEAALAEPGTAMICAIDLGEDNDLHPHDKREIGERLALLAEKICYGLDVETSGPSVSDAWLREWTVGGTDSRVLYLACEHADGLTIRDAGKGTKINDFSGITDDGERIPLELHGIFSELKQIAVKLPTDRKIKEVRFLDSNTYTGGLFCNTAGLPMGPFCCELQHVRLATKE